MNTNWAIIIGACIIAGGILVSRPMVTYEIAAAVDAQGNPFVWRLDAKSGEIEYCSFSQNPFDKIGPARPIKCSGELMPQKQ